MGGYGGYDFRTRTQAAYQGVTYTTPADKTYRIGIYREKLPVTVPAGPISEFFGRADRRSCGWTRTKTHDFSNDKPMMEYHVREDVGVFGTDDPTKAARNTIPFVIMVRPDRKFIHVTMDRGAHGSMMSVAALARIFSAAKRVLPRPKRVSR